MKRSIIFSVVFLCAISGQISWGQEDRMAPLPLDESVIYGVLDNGMTYYIKSNQEPKERASFYIVQNVGALLEEDHQNGLAHFLEHMAFNGTKHFPDKGIINFLERHGVAFGNDINAYTAHNQTVYNLSDVPVNKPGILDTCLLILNDWSNYLLLTDEEIDAERGVIKEEWRTRRSNVQYRMYVASLPYIYKGSKFAERTVIGSMDVIENFEYDALRDFYHTWYRTDLQAIIMVGDFDAEEMEKKVVDLFSSIPPVKDAPERPFYEIPDNQDPLYALVTDKEASNTTIHFKIRHRKASDNRENLVDLREGYIQQLFGMMMGQRLEELLQTGNPPFIVGMVNYGDFERGYESLDALVVPKPNEEAQGLAALLTELERARRYGFTTGELERAKAEILTQWEKYYNERDKISNESYCDDYINHFLNGKAGLPAETAYELVQALLPTITQEDFKQRLNAWISEENRMLLIKGPEGEDVTHLNKGEAFAVISEVAASEIEPYEEEELAASLINEELPAIPVMATRELKDFNAVEWTLKNGAKVIFRHADFEKDQVQIMAFSRGGSSIYEDGYIPTTDMLTALNSFYGVGDFDASTLQKMLTGKNVSLALSLGGLSEGLSGKATPKDMEILMQWLYLSFVKPRFDEEAHKAIMARYEAYWQNLENNPQKIMGDSLNLILTNYHPRTRVMDLDYLSEIELAKLEEVYRGRYADASDFFFVIVGNMEEEELKLMAQKYIGAIPDLDRKESWVDRKIREPKGVVEKIIPMDLENPKADVNIIIKKPMPYNASNKIIMDVISGILDLRYVETIREEEGGTYGVSVRTSLEHWPEEKAGMQISFDCDPERAAELKEKVYAELDKLAASGPSEVDLSKTVENMLKKREQAKEHNSYYLNSIYSYYVHGINFNDPANYEDILRSMKVKDVKKVMNTFYTKPNIVDVTFVPKEQ